MNNLTYTPRYFVLWGTRESHRYLMHPALAIARKMRQRGLSVTVCIERANHE